MTPDVICMFPLSSFLQLVSKYHNWWLWCQLNTVKQGLKNHFLIFLSPSMLQYIELQIMCSVCGISMEYRFFTVLSDMQKVIFNHWTPYGVTFWYTLHCWFVGNNWIDVKNLGVYGERVQIIPQSCCTHIALMNPKLPNVWFFIVRRSNNKVTLGKVRLIILCDFYWKR